MVACFIAEEKRIPFKEAVKIVEKRYPKAQIEPELMRIRRQLFP